MSNILVIGSNGLLGRSLVKHFVLNGLQVGALSRSRCENIEGFESYTVDVLNYKSLEPVVALYDVIINCIGQITHPIYECIALNTNGIGNIVRAVNKNKNHLIHLSTVSVYGSLLFATEESLVNPESVYGSLKYFAEYQVSSGLSNFTILRISNLYGSEQKKGIVGYVLRTFYNKKKNLYFDNDGSLKRYYIHIDDVSSMVELILKKNIKGTYNIGSDDFLTVKQLIDVCERELDYSFDVVFEAKKPIENIDKIDDSKLKNKIHYIQKHNIETYLNSVKDIML